MTSNESELKKLMIAGLGGDSVAHRALLERLSRHSPFVGIMILAAISLLSAPSSHWEAMIVGNEWLECLLRFPSSP
jgi:hypothetical protein